MNESQADKIEIHFSETCWLVLPSTVENQATPEEVEKAKALHQPPKPSRTSAKAKAAPKTRALKGGKGADPVPPASPPSAQKSPNPVPAKRLKGKQSEREKDPQEIIKELQEAASCCQDCFLALFSSICCSSVGAVLSTQVEIMMIIDFCKIYTHGRQTKECSWRWRRWEIRTCQGRVLHTKRLLQRLRHPHPPRKDMFRLKSIPLLIAPLLKQRGRKWTDCADSVSASRAENATSQMRCMKGGVRPQKRRKRKWLTS